MKKINEAVDMIRREESRLDYHSAKYLKNSRWVLLKREDNLTENQVIKLKDLLERNLKSVKAYLLKNNP
jgi:transposase